MVVIVMGRGKLIDGTMDNKTNFIYENDEWFDSVNIFFKRKIDFVLFKKKKTPW